MKLRTMLPLLVVVALVACSVKKDLVPTGGSRADGVVRLSYSYGVFQTPVVDPQQGVAAATSRCKAWGYDGAEPFGGNRTECTQYSGGSCGVMTVTTEYQCLGGNAAHP